MKIVCFEFVIHYIPPSIESVDKIAKLYVLCAIKIFFFLIYNFNLCDKNYNYVFVIFMCSKKVDV